MSSCGSRRRRTRGRRPGGSREIARPTARRSRDAARWTRAGDRPVLLAFGVQRFGHAVAERDDEVARLELQTSLRRTRLLEEAEHHAAGFETAHAGSRDEHGRVVAAVGVNQRAVAAEHAVERRQKPVFDRPAEKAVIDPADHDAPGSSGTSTRRRTCR